MKFCQYILYVLLCPTAVYAGNLSSGVNSISFGTAIDETLATSKLGGPLPDDYEEIEGTDRYVSVFHDDEEGINYFILDLQTRKEFKDIGASYKSFLMTSREGLAYFYENDDRTGYIVATDGTIVRLPVGMIVEGAGRGMLKATLAGRSILLEPSRLSLLSSMLCTNTDREFIIDQNVEVQFNGISPLISGFSMMIDYPSEASKANEAIRFWMSEEIRDLIDSKSSNMPNQSKGMYLPINDTTSTAIYDFYKREYCRLYTKEDSVFHSFSADICIGEQMNSKDVVTYYVGKYYFDGGNHGMINKYFKSFDKRTGAPFTLENVFKKGSIDKILDILHKRIGNIYSERHEGDAFTLPLPNKLDDVDSDMEVEYFQFPNMGIGLLPEGIAFCYQPYEIDAFAYGDYNIIIPYEDFEGLLNINKGKIFAIQSELSKLKLRNFDVRYSEYIYDIDAEQTELVSKREIVDNMRRENAVYSSSFLQNITDLVYLSEKHNYSSTAFEAACIALSVADSLYGYNSGITIAAADRFVYMAEPSEAIIVLKRTLRQIDKHYGTNNSAYADRLQLLINYENDLEQHDSIINHSNELIAIHENIYGSVDNTGITYDLYSLIAQQHAILGNYKEAIKSQEKAIDFSSFDINPYGMQSSMDALIKGEIDKSIGYERLMFYYYMDGQYERAIKIGETYLENMTHADDTLSFNDKDIILSILYYRNNNLDEAVRKTKKWVKKLPRYIVENFRTMKNEERNGLWNKYAYYYNDFLPLLALQSNDKELQAETYNAILLGKSIMLNTEMELRQSIVSSNNTTVIELYDQMVKNSAAISNPDQELNSWEMDSLKIKVGYIEDELLRKSDVYGNYMRKLGINYIDIITNLRDNDLAIEFAKVSDLGNDIYMAIVLKKSVGYPKIVPLFNGKQLKTENDFYKTTFLSQLVWRNLSDYLNNDVDNVYFAPAGELYNIAIESLPHWKKNGLVSDYWSFYRLSSTREIVLSDNNNKQITNAVIYGGLCFDTDLDYLVEDSRHYSSIRDLSSSYPTTTDSLYLREVVQTINELPATKIEAERIQKTLERMKVNTSLYTEKKGTEASFKALSGKRKDLLHIATHGFYWTEEEVNSIDYDFYHKSPNQEDMALTRSGLLLSGANSFLLGKLIPEKVEDGVLTAKEIAMLDMHGLNLVVLSACQTGLGDVLGDGVFGLQRGFKKAGAKALLMSLWKVDDNATQLLMTKFYDFIASGKTKYEALEGAKEAVRSHKGWDDPKYWAAFILLDGLD